MEPVSAVICTLNEEQNIGPCILSVKDADEVIVADDGSTDGTVAIAQALGAKVIRRSDWSVRTTLDDYGAFHDRFGWWPSFKVGDRIRNGHLESREAVSFAANDWVVMPDADERVSWDLPLLRKLIDKVGPDQIEHEYVHVHNPDGSPVSVGHSMKMYRRSKTVIDGRVHGVIIPTKVAGVDFMRIDHWQKPGHSQSYVLPILEYCVLTDDDQRSRFYLGRELYYYHQYDRALKLLNIYLTDATGFMPEIQKARIYEARCYWETGRGDEARATAQNALLLNPEDPEAMHLMGDVFAEPWSHKWHRLATVANGEDALW